MISNFDMDAVFNLDLTAIKGKLMHHQSGEGWSALRTDSVEREYKRFLYLMKTFPTELTAPTVDVDTFWHYHILDTMKYAADCEQAFGYFLHHYPYIGMEGGADDAEVHQAAGERMREIYEATFGESYSRASIAGAAAYCGIVPPTITQAYCGIVPPTSTPAYCSLIKPAASATAYCGIVKPPVTDAAYCGVVKPPVAKAAYCGVVKPPMTDAAYCGVVKPPMANAAYCGVVKPPMANAAYCGVVKPPMADAAYCGVVKPPVAKAAYCGIVKPPVAETAYCGIVKPPCSAGAGELLTAA
jgi:hypothetical protein